MSNPNGAFSQMVNKLSHIKDIKDINFIAKKISIIEYGEFQKQWIMDALKGYRFGQSFCEYFEISNASPLYYFKSNKFAEQWINDNYLKNED